MTHRLDPFLHPARAVLGIGEPTHGEPAFGWLRNRLFGRLVEQGFRSIALETDRIAALAVDDYVRGGPGTLDDVMATGFSHGLGRSEPTRDLVTALRRTNEGRPPQDRVAVYGFDAPLEMISAASPRPYLERVCRYLGEPVDLDDLAGPDEPWTRTEAIMDPAASVGASSDAVALRSVADDLLIMLYARAPELIAAGSLTEWRAVEAHAKAALGLLRYHRLAALPPPEATRVSRMLGVRDAIMAQNLLDLRTAETDRGPTLVHAHNRHLQRHRSTMRLGELDLEWHSAGAILAGLLGDRYGFIVGSLGASPALRLGEPAPDTIEAGLQSLVDGWGLVGSADVPAGRTRTDAEPRQGYFPLDPETIDRADAVLHVADGSTVTS